MALTLHRFRAHLAAQDLSPSTTRQYVTWVRAALRSVGVLHEVDLGKLSQPEIFHAYLGTMAPQSRAMCRAALRSFAAYCECHGMIVAVPEGIITPEGAVPLDVSRAWRKLERLIVSDGVDPETVVWDAPDVPQSADVLRLTQDGIALAGPRSGHVTYNELDGQARVLHRWSMQRAGGPVGGAPCAPARLLRWLRDGGLGSPEETITPLPQAQVPQSGDAPSPGDWDAAIDADYDRTRRRPIE